MAITMKTPAETQVGFTRDSGLGSGLPEEVPEAPREQPPVRLEVRGLTKVFGADTKAATEMLAAGAGNDEVHDKLGVVVAVDNASFEVRAGEIFVIMGLSGSGKSTIIRLLNRLIETTADAILLDGRALAQMSRRKLIEVRRAEMGLTFQSLRQMLPLHNLPDTCLHAGIGAARENVRGIGLGGSLLPTPNDFRVKRRTHATQIANRECL